MASITLKTSVLVTLSVPDSIAGELSKQDICDAAVQAVRRGETQLVYARGFALGSTVEPSFDPLPASEGEVYADDGSFPNVRG